MPNDAVDTENETAHEMLERIGCDAVKWADAFSKIATGLGYSEMDEDWLIGWFANAIEQSARAHPDVKRLLARAEAAERQLVNADAECNRWMEVSDKHKAERDAARAEARKLREALQWMVDNDDTNEGDTPLDDYGGRTWNEMNAYWIEGLNRARTALEGGSP